MWVRASSRNFVYCLRLAREMSKEYTRRFGGKVHACAAHLDAIEAMPLPDCPPESRLDELTLATVDIPDEVADFPICFGDDAEACTRRDASGAIMGVASHLLYYMAKSLRIAMRWDRSYEQRAQLAEHFERVSRDCAPAAKRARVASQL